MGDEFDDTSLDVMDIAPVEDTMLDTSVEDPFDIPESFEEDSSEAFLYDSSDSSVGEDLAEVPLEFEEDVDALNDVNDPDPYDMPESFAEDTEEITADDQNSVTDDTSEMFIEDTAEVPTEFDEDLDDLNEINDPDPYDIPESFEEDTEADIQDIQADIPEGTMDDFPEDTDAADYVTDSVSSDVPESFIEDTETDWTVDPNDMSAENTGDPDIEISDTAEATPSAYDELKDYMTSHNYGPQHASEYSEDPQWQELNNAYRIEQGLEPIDYGHQDWTDTHVDDMRAELVARGIPADSPELEAILQNEQQGIDEIRNEHCASDAIPQEAETSEDDVADNLTSITLSELEEQLEYGTDADRLRQLRDGLSSGEIMVDANPESNDSDDSGAGSNGPAYISQSELEEQLEYGTDADSLRQLRDGLSSGEIGIIPDAVNPTDIASNETADVLDDIDFDSVYSGLDHYDFDGIDVGADVVRLDSSLENFQNATWENLSTDEQKAAMSDLADYVKDIVGFENPPDIVYYNNPVEGDYGGYSPDTNTLSVNEYMLYDNNEAADTIAHELWHAYQHERAMNPQSAKDYQYQYGFDNYIRPEDDFTAYQDQLVEAEARAFAQQFKDRLKVKGRGI